MSRTMRVVLLAVLVAVAVTASACKENPKKPSQPQVAPPAVGTTGVLRAGVDLHYPPFAGSDAGQSAGIDVDVAAALAERLGLRLQLVQVEPSSAATALANGLADVVLSVPLKADQLSGVTFTRTYISDGPGLFAVVGTGSVNPSLTVESLGNKSVGAQEASPAFWILEDQLGAGVARPFSTLFDAYDALKRGDVDVAAGDIVVMSYIARDTPGIRLVGQLAPATPIGAAVKPGNTKLAEAVTRALDGLAADGVLATIRRKWVGDLPRLRLSSGSLESSSSTPVP